MAASASSLSVFTDSASINFKLTRWISSSFVFGYFVVFFAFALSRIEALPLQGFHHQMTTDELQSVFQVNNHLEVPEYELVHIRSLRKRDNSDDGSATKEIHLSAFGKDFRLRLQRNDHLSKSADRLKMFVAEMHTDGNLNLTEVTFPGNSSDIGEVYQDDASGAAVILHHAQDGTLLLDGTIGSNLAIKPAPSRMRTEPPHFPSPFPDDEMFLDNELPPKTESEKTLKEKQAFPTSTTSTVSATTGKGVHIVYQRKQAENSTFSDYMFMEPDRLPLPAAANNRSTRSVRHRREAPEAVWPEILVIVDYDTYNMHGGNNMDIKRYFISFWNGVDLRYKLLGGPKVRISLAGIIISKGRDATPYLENNRVGGNAVDSAGALTELGKYLFRERRLPTYDIAVVVTKLDLCRREFTMGACNKGTAGFAYVGGACVVNKRLEKVNSVAIIEDTGGFSGIIVAAHEVGHLLGAVHDGSPPPSYLGGPGAEHCRWEDGYIMSDLRHTERGFKWSICSTQQFKHFLNGDTAKCLYNIPHEDDELPRLLPGKLLSLDAQCRKDRGTSACFKDDRVCAQLFCFDSRSGYCVSYRPAAEGSPCGDGQFCINGQCIAENENVIPDYSRVSEVIVPKPNDLNLPENPNPAIAKGSAGEESDPSSGLKRTAILDDEDQVSIVSVSDHKQQPPPPPPPPPPKRTSVLDTDDDHHLEVNHHSHFSNGEVSHPLPSPKRTSVLDDIGLDEPSHPQSHAHSDPAEPPKRLDGSEESYPSPDLHISDMEVAHIRRTSHLDEMEKFSFEEDGGPTTSRNLPNAVTKRREIQSFDKVQDSDLVSETGCRDIMRELAGGLTCKQFLRRFGDRYCNHHYIIAHCCASRKLICEV